ncbi:MAG: TlpA family protein disulfide reductase [Rickettsiales bacterium]
MMTLRHIAAFACIAIISTSALAKESKYYTWVPYDPPIAAPAGKMQMLKGMRSLKEFEGHAVLLNFWATWCVPCLKELPTLDALEKDWGDKGLIVLPLSLDSKPYQTLRDFFDKSGLALPHLAVDRGEVSQALEWDALPVTFLINRKGKIIAYWAGATNWTDPKHEAWLKKTLAK